MYKFFIYIRTHKEKCLIWLLVGILLFLILPIGWQFIIKNSVKESIISAPNNLTITEEAKEQFVPTFANLHEINTFEDIQKYIFYVDSTAYVLSTDFPITKLAALDLTFNIQGAAPRVLITHTHANEFFVDSIEGNMDHSIVAVGRLLAEILANDHGVTVVHDIGQYDIVNNELMREGAYERMEQGVKKILEKYPSIELIIDLHRDAMPQNRRLVTTINGKDTARIMFFNGLTRRNVDGEPQELYELFNPYIMENLALSLQMFLTANQEFPGFARRNYIKAYRYSLHMLPRSLLIEVGANTNTLEEAKNAMEPLAFLLMEVLDIS